MRQLWFYLVVEPGPAALSEAKTNQPCPGLSLDKIGFSFQVEMVANAEGEDNRKRRGTEGREGETCEYTAEGQRV